MAFGLLALLFGSAFAALVVAGVAITHTRDLSRERLRGVSPGRGVAMDLNEYYAEHLIKDRLADLYAEAHRDRLRRLARPPHRPLRVALGTALIKVGAWLLRDQYVSPSAL
ncbi:MAG TPA: hypothetical protein VGV13_05385 [Methylomirabilota bacterium]|nr:hypothetical protein [Methylomirabilota bacterium]